ncbi:MAG: hypothetical protein ABIJ41_05650 [Candidatus Omnitrophota bacterium]
MPNDKNRICENLPASAFGLIEAGRLILPARLSADRQQASRRVNLRSSQLPFLHFGMS